MTEWMKYAAIYMCGGIFALSLHSGHYVYAAMLMGLALTIASGILDAQKEDDNDGPG